jgi:hypothetical protein
VFVVISALLLVIPFAARSVMSSNEFWKTGTSRGSGVAVAVAVAVAAAVGCGVLVGPGGRVAVGVLLPQDVRTNITTIARVFFMIDTVSSLTLRPIINYTDSSYAAIMP